VNADGGRKSITERSNDGCRIIGAAHRRADGNAPASHGRQRVDILRADAADREMRQPTPAQKFAQIIGADDSLLVFRRRREHRTDAAVIGAVEQCSLRLTEI
jgi:hypothetical protein